MMVNFLKARLREDTARELLRERAAIASIGEARAEQKLSEAFLGGYVMRRNSVKLSALLACALVGGALGLNCSKSSNPSSGDVQLALVLPDGSTVTSVSYQVKSSSNAVLASGTINVSDPNAKISLDVVLPVTPTGDPGDTVSLTATSSTGQACTGTSSAFPVLANQTTSVPMTLQCGNGSASGATGSLGVTATLVQGDNCPNITSAAVGPDETSVGGTATVSATATDADKNETVSFAWAPAANFASPTSASTTYTCTASGTQTFTLTVSDNHVPQPCTTQATFTIKCDAVGVCGNGIIEPGEQCDPPNGTTCSSTCQIIPPATGGTTGTAGTTGAAGATGTGGTTGVAGATGTGGTTGVAGATGTGGTTGVAGATGSGGTGVFAQDNAACVSCETAGTNAGVCFTTSPTNASGTPLGGFGCDGFPNATDKANCLALLGCLRSTACQNVIHAAGTDYGESGVNFDDGTPCLCETATSTQTKNACLGMTTGWPGVCAAQFVAASSNSTSSSNPVASLFDPQFPVGVAMNLMTCDIDSSQTGSGTPSCITAGTCKVPQ
jgi:hypothetical protein